jgi:hypothetical protein
MNFIARRRGMTDTFIHARGSLTIRFGGFGFVSMPYAHLSVCSGHVGTPTAARNQPLVKLPN